MDDMNEWPIYVPIEDFSAGFNVLQISVTPLNGGTYCSMWSLHEVCMNHHPILHHYYHLRQLYLLGVRKTEHLHSRSANS